MQNALVPHKWRHYKSIWNASKTEDFFKYVTLFLLYCCKCYKKVSLLIYLIVEQIFEMCQSAAHYRRVKWNTRKSGILIGGKFDFAQLSIRYSDFFIYIGLVWNKTCEVVIRFFLCVLVFVFLSHFIFFSRCLSFGCQTADCVHIVFSRATLRLQVFALLKWL